MVLDSLLSLLLPNNLSLPRQSGLFKPTALVLVHGVRTDGLLVSPGKADNHLAGHLITGKLNKKQACIYLTILLNLYFYIAVKFCESFNPVSSKFRNGISFHKTFSNNRGRRIKFCKFILRVHCKSANFAAMSRLGTYPYHRITAPFVNNCNILFRYSVCMHFPLIPA